MTLATRLLPALAMLIFLAAPAMAQDARTIVTTEGADYFGFDLRTEQNVTLQTCKATCLADTQCRAFTYNTKARWCFLKSDHNALNPFPGAVAGKVVDVAGEPDIGAPPALAFFARNLVDEAIRQRQQITSGPETPANLGLGVLEAGAESALASGNARQAREFYLQALAIDPDDAGSWLGLSRSAAAIDTSNYQESADLKRDATAAAWNGYELTRSAPARAEALAVMAVALDRRDLSRPALSAYEASLALVNDPQVRAAYVDLKARKGFRVVDHTVDSDSASPRVCVQFSEDLTHGDYGPFVTVDGGPAKAIEAKAKQLCIADLEHGKSYRVTLRSGLPAAIGEVLESPVALNVYVRDRTPAVRFTGDNFVLPSAMRHGIPVVSVNTGEVDLQLFRIGERALARLITGSQFLHGLDSYAIETVRNDLGTPVWEGKLDVASDLNKEVVTSFPVDEALPKREPGVYVMTARPKGDRSEDWIARATQWFVVSDIGLSTFAGQDGLNVFIRSLASAKPMPGVELNLIARDNEILGTATTDEAGRAVFAAGLSRGEAAMAPAAITAKKDGDFVFLDMTRGGFDLSDRGVTGRPSPGALDVYAWTERGIYRAGETVHGAALARDEAAKAVDDLPLTFIFSRPDGVEDRRVVSTDSKLGGRAVDLALQANAMRGTWSMRVYTDPKQAPVAETSFLVEDFVPDRTEFDLSAERQEIAIGESTPVTVSGRYLYGAPAAGLSLEGEINVAPTREWKSLPGYLFGLDEEEDEEARATVPLAGLPVLDEQGKATFDVRLDAAPSTTRLLNASIVVRMSEAGGRAVERKLDLAVKPQGPMIGIKPAFSGDQVAENSTAAFNVVAIGPDGQRVGMPGAHWSLQKVERSYQWYRQDNSWNYEPVTSTEEVANGSLDIAADGETRVSAPVAWGRYRLEITTDDPAGPATSVAFDAGWFVAMSSTETPDALDVGLDRDMYAAGDTAKLTVSPRFAGELLVTVGSERLLSTITAHVPADGTTLDIPVSADWGAGAYVTATLYRPGDDRKSRMPMRAIGVKWLKIDPGAARLDVSLDTPEKTLPRAPLTIPVSIGGAGQGDRAYVMVAAVDVGILNLTRYEPPDPEQWYFGQRQLGLEIRDLYGRLIDGSAGVAGRIRTGGDGANMATQGSPPTEKLVAFFSGPVETGPDGKATVSFDLPQFNGTVRVMAVAWTSNAVGHAVSDVIVRDPIVMTASPPRFLAPGDNADMRLDIANTDAPAGDYALDVEANGGLLVGDVPSSVTLGTSGRQSVTIPVGANAAGDASLTLRLTGGNGIDVAQTLVLPIRPAAMPVTTRRVVSLAAHGGALTVDKELLAGSLLDGASVSVGVSPLAAFDVPSLLVSLDRYPYGCAEQTTSRALPLLYVNDLAKSSGMEPDPELKKRIQEAVYKVLSYQSSAGSFGLWAPGSGDLWLDAYVTDFLTRAREKGFDIPDEAMRLALSNLQNSLSYNTDVKDKGNEIAYALYVLARNRQASVGDLRYYADTKLGDFETAMARAQIAAGLALYGDRQRAQSAFASALALAEAGNGDLSNAGYGSALRDGAAMLALAAETRPTLSLLPQMVGAVANERKSKDMLSTQEEAWMLLAARAISSGDDAIRIDVDGTPHQGAFAERRTGEEMLDSPLTITNRGSDPVDAVVTTIAAPADPLPAGGDGFAIERAYYTMDGQQTDVSQATQNERYVVVLKVTEENSWPSHVVVTDLLPAGFQIDNPHLVGSAELSNFPWLGQTDAAHSEFRDDRFVAAFDRTADSSRQFTMAYVVRAVTPGTYAHPAAEVEDMYRRYLSARSATGVMRVTAGK